MQGSSCMRINLPRNPFFFFFASTFTCMLLYSLFLVFSCFQSFCFTCLFACLLSHVRIRVYLVFCCFDTMNMHSHAHAWWHRCWIVARKVKVKTCVCIECAFVMWSCLGLMIIVISMPWMMTCFDWPCFYYWFNDSHVSALDMMIKFMMKHA